MRLDLLDALARKLENDAPADFDMNQWAACAIKVAAGLPEFREAGLNLISSRYRAFPFAPLEAVEHPVYNGDIFGDWGFSEFPAIAAMLGCTLDEAFYIADSRRYEKMTSPKTTARHIRKVMTAMRKRARELPKSVTDIVNAPAPEVATA